MGHEDAAEPRRVLPKVTLGRHGANVAALARQYRYLGGDELLDEVETLARALRGVRICHILSGFGNMEVNVFQRGGDVVIQKSIREGFGLVVSEALWKERPVVAGRAGGIPMQFPDGYDRYLIASVEECAARVIHLLERPGERGAFARAGREHVRRGFLLPRLLRDELRLIRELV